MIVYLHEIKQKVNPFLALMSSSDSDKAKKAAKFLYSCSSAMLVDLSEKYPDGWETYWSDIKKLSEECLAAGENDE